MPLKNKYSAICNELKSRIANGFYSSNLPPRRQLMLEFNVSSRTMHKVFCELKLSGLISPTPGGTAVNPSVSSLADRQMQILLISSAENDFTGQSDTCTRIMELAENNLAAIVPYVRKEAAPGMEDILKQTITGSCDGVIFLNSSYTSSDGKFLKARNIPFVSGNRPKAGEVINWVDWNHLELFDDLLCEAVNRGARSIDFFMLKLPNGKPPDNAVQIMEDFRAAKKSYMFYNPKLDARKLTETDNVEKYARFLAGLKHLPDMIYLVYDDYCKLVAELQKYGLDLSSRMICMGGICEDDEHTQICYTRRARRQLGEKIWKLLLYMRHHPNEPPRGIKQRCELKLSNDFKKIKIYH